MTKNEFLSMCDAAGIRRPDYIDWGYYPYVAWEGPTSGVTVEKNRCVCCGKPAWDIHLHWVGGSKDGGHITTSVGDMDRLKRAVEWVDKQLDVKP